VHQTEQGFAVAKETHHRMLQDVLAGLPLGQVLMEENDDIRRRLHAALHVSPDIASIILFPSGSDAELVPTVSALIRSYSLSCTSNKSEEEVIGRTKVFSFVCGAGEVGSGTAKASGAKHFSNVSNALKDVTVADGRFLDGVSEGIILPHMHARISVGSVNNSAI
jgi:hypothetical protein